MPSAPLHEAAPSPQEKFDPAAARDYLLTLAGDKGITLPPRRGASHRPGC